MDAIRDNWQNKVDGEDGGFHSDDSFKVDSYGDDVGPEEFKRSNTKDMKDSAIDWKCKKFP